MPLRSSKSERRGGALLACILLLICSRAAAHGQRQTLSLNGQWQIADSTDGDFLPAAFPHTAPVPGLAHSAIPAFADVDQFQSRELLNNMVRQGTLSKAEYQALGNSKGISHQQRNYFWYQRTFTAPVRRGFALLRVNKAQFGAVVYLNGVRIGDHAPCFTSVTFDVTKALHWNAPNELVIRIGAHPGVLPDDVSAGTDFEKNRWTPGIYDDVSVSVMDNPVIQTVQVAPHIETGQVVVQTELRNVQDDAVTVALRQQVQERITHAPAGVPVVRRVSVPAHGTRTVLQTLTLPQARLWSPDSPFLYVLKTSTGGDSQETRFGMREFRFDTPTRRAYLNGKPFFLRGSNITLHRFFEDPDAGTLPWDEAWLQRLLVTLPKSMHWNAFRFCIGPVPDRWLEIADENGLLIENEYPVWVGRNWGGYIPHINQAELTTEYREWMRDNWNHPSVVLWDATNESWLPGISERVIPAVRELDLSHRAWENSYNAPSGPDDPVEDHQYLFQAYATASDADVKTKTFFRATDIEKMLGPMASGETYKSGHSSILNEYGWLWLNRNGSPTLLTRKLYERLLPGDRNTTENRVALEAYLLAGETEFWRSTRHYAGVLQFVYLTSSDPGAFTSDHFRNVRTLELEPHFQHAMEQAFHPLGVYLNFWQPSLVTSSTHDYTVSLVNDEARPLQGRLALQFVNEAGIVISREEIAFRVDPAGSQSYTLALQAPGAAGKYSLNAVALPNDAAEGTVTSHRDVLLEAGNR